MANGERGGRRQQGRRSRPLDPAGLQETALRYVSRFATTRIKLIGYLDRKLKERGWADGELPPDIEALADRLADLGYVDDAAFALAKAGSLGRRGYGPGRVEQALRQSGVSEEDGEEARLLARRQAIEAALRFAQRKRLGPWRTLTADPRAGEKGLAAMLRAGHAFGVSRAIIQAEAGADLCPESLSEYVVIKEP